MLYMMPLGCCWVEWHLLTQDRWQLFLYWKSEMPPNIFPQYQYYQYYQYQTGSLDIQHLTSPRKSFAYLSNQWKPTLQVSRTAIFLKIYSILDFHKERNLDKKFDQSAVYCICLKEVIPCKLIFSICHFQLQSLFAEVSAYYPQRVLYSGKVF